MASIKDVAQKAGVGVGTVSRVLNNSGYVSDETREKIEEAMKNLQYTPNELARNLYHKKSGKGTSVDMEMLGDNVVRERSASYKNIGAGKNPDNAGDSGTDRRKRFNLY